MVTINFPSSPSLNDTYSFGGRSWTYDGIGWRPVHRNAYSVFNASTDGLVPASGGSATHVLYANGVFTNVIVQVSTGKLLGRTTASVGNHEEISVANSLTLSAGVLSVNTANLSVGVGGANTQVLFNDSGFSNGSAAFTFNKSTNVVSISANLSVGAQSAFTGASVFSNSMYTQNIDVGNTSLSSWHASHSVIEMRMAGRGLYATNTATGEMGLFYNLYYDAAHSSWKYVANGRGYQLYLNQNGALQFNIAEIGTAGANVANSVERWSVDGGGGMTIDTEDGYDPVTAYSNNALKFRVQSNGAMLANGSLTVTGTANLAANVTIGGTLNVSDNTTNIRTTISFDTGNGLRLWNRDNSALSLGTDNVSRISIGGTGAVTVGAPTSNVVSLTVNGNSVNTSAAAILVNGAASLTTSGWAKGIKLPSAVSVHMDTYNGANTGRYAFFGGTSDGQFYLGRTTLDDGTTAPEYTFWVGANAEFVVNKPTTFNSTAVISGTANVTGAVALANTLGVTGLATFSNSVWIGVQDTPVALSSILHQYGQVFIGNSLLGGAGTNLRVMSNCYYDSGHTLRRKGASSSGYFEQSGNAWTFYTAPSGTANADISANSALCVTMSGGGLTGYARFEGDVEIRGASMPQNSQSAAYTTVAADANKHLLHPSSDNNARTFTVANNSSVPYQIGTAITIVNMANTLTIAINNDTMYLAANGATGSRTLANTGVATLLKIGSTTWIISGTGLT